VTREFSVAGPTVWNSLPGRLWDPAVDSEQFRRHLKMYLFAGHSKCWCIRGVYLIALYKSTFTYLLTQDVDDGLWVWKLMVENFLKFILIFPEISEIC